MKNIEKLREKYRIYCIINNLIENEQGFKGYVSDQKMLERIRKSKQETKEYMNKINIKM